MIHGKYDLSDVLWGAAGIALTIMGCAFMVCLAVLAIAGAVKCVQSMFAPAEEIVIEETADGSDT